MAVSKVKTSWKRLNPNFMIFSSIIRNLQGSTEISLEMTCFSYFQRRNVRSSSVLKQIKFKSYSFLLTACSGSIGIPPLFLKLGTRCRSVVNFINIITNDICSLYGYRKIFYIFLDFWLVMFYQLQLIFIVFMGNVIYFTFFRFFMNIVLPIIIDIYSCHGYRKIFNIF